jgi:hypothetical protein
MTFTRCWNHLEAAVVTEAADIKSVSERSKLQGGTEIISAVITIQDFTNGKMSGLRETSPLAVVVKWCSGIAVSLLS